VSGSPLRIPTSSDLARAVKLFHGPGKWTDAMQAEWNRLTGEPPTQTIARSACLVEMADAVIESEIRIDIAPDDQGGR
jgi:hypothetical protein